MRHHSDLCRDEDKRVPSLPLILIVDDELGVEDLFQTTDGIDGRWVQRARERRHEYCRTLRLLPVEDGADLDIEQPIARARFMSCLRWNDRLNSIPDPGLLTQEIKDTRTSSPPGYALVLLDLQFEYGAFNQESGNFSIRHAAYGMDVLLPAIKNTFGFDSASVSGRWLGIPVVIVSWLSKNELDPRIRAGGARGMLEKRMAPEILREALRIHLADHGLLPDERGIIVGHSLALLNCLAAARRAAQVDLNVLLLGETGTGKELLARYVHDHSPRRDGPYCIFHAPGRAETLQEDELFGHVKGAFTGAQSEHVGLLEQARGGTLFVDEIADVGQTVQRALMRPVEQGKAKRVGASKEYEIDVRFVFATNKEIHQYAKTGMFLPDLLSRIEQVTIHLPPLRERKEDIPLLAESILAKVDGKLGGVVNHYVDSEALRDLSGRAFSESNVRELENLLQDAAIANRNETRLTSADLAPEEPTPSQGAQGGGQEEPSHQKCASGLPLFFDLAMGNKEWNRLTLEQAQYAGESLKGLSPQLIVKLLELSLQACRLEGRAFSMVRMMGHFWGRKDLTSQQARRALDRLLKAEPNGLIARGALKSSALMAEPRVAGAIRAVLKGKFEDE